MKKMMRDENLMKISEMADRSITETAVAGILLCYVLYRVDEPMESELLYSIAVTGEIINFFTYQEAICSLEQNKCIEASYNDAHEKIYTLTEIGIDTAKKLRNIAAKSYRDQIVTSAKLAIRRKRNEREVNIQYENVKNGCQLHVTLMDQDLQLLDLTLFTPDEDTARQLGERILLNPSALYHDVIQSVIKYDETPIDINDD